MLLYSPFVQFIQKVFPCLKNQDMLENLIFQVSFKNNDAKPMCSDIMKTRLWVFRTNTNQINHLPYWPSMFLLCWFDTVTSIQSDLCAEYSEQVLIMLRGCSAAGTLEDMPLSAPVPRASHSCKIEGISLGGTWEHEGAGWSEGELGAGVSSFSSSRRGCRSGSVDESRILHGFWHAQFCLRAERCECFYFWEKSHRPTCLPLEPLH